ncbi:MAG: hypothetical protein CM15mP12_3290 [Gammaproteobacteria bacterium]|nr:MAG: hypothetical protein CM15mP12_3290 [Gammaproteobacteria bacterium]
MQCFIGQGVILSLDSLLKEIQEIEEKGIGPHGKLKISRYCSLLLPIHAKIDQLREDNKNAIEQPEEVLVQHMRTRQREEA